MSIQRTASWACAASACLCLLGASASFAEQTEKGFTPSETFQAWVTDLARQELPEKYEKRKNWGNKKRVLAGWDFEAKGLKVETRRRWKEVNDGTWTHYKVTPLDPDQHFAVRVEQIEQIAGNKVRLQLAAISKVRLDGRLSQWERGVQLVSLSAAADAKVRLDATVEIGLKLDAGKLPPDVTLVPTVTAADVQIAEFELRSVGKFDGPLVQSLSHETRDVLAAELAQRRPKLVSSLNKQLAKKQDKLKFSLSDLLTSEWGKFAPAGLKGEQPPSDK